MISILVFIILLLPFQNNPPKKDLGDAPDKNIIVWSPNKKLEWNDYTKVKYSVGNGAAASDVKIKYKILKYRSKDSLDIYIYSSFNKKNSWVLSQHEDSIGLEHERHHFEITEIYAREFRKEVQKMKFYSDDFVNLYNEMIRKEGKAQEQYDNATNHSLNRIKQEEWDKKIDGELVALDEYSAMHVIVKNYQSK